MSKGKDKFPSINDPVKRPNKTDVYYDKHMKMWVPVHKKAKSKKVNSKLKIKTA